MYREKKHFVAASHHRSNLSPAVPTKIDTKFPYEAVLLKFLLTVDAHLPGGVARPPDISCAVVKRF